MAKGEGFTILQVGRTRTGKTTTSMEFLDQIIENDTNRKIYIYDVNKEYTAYYNKPLKNFGDFLTEITPVIKSFVLFEEATIFFTPRGGVDKIMIDKLVRKRHQQNILMLNFHSWSQVPRDIVSMVDYVIVKKTNDTLKHVMAKTDDEKILKAFNKVKESLDNFETIHVDIYGT